MIRVASLLLAGAVCGCGCTCGSKALPAAVAQPPRTAAMQAARPSRDSAPGGTTREGAPDGTTREGAPDGTTREGAPDGTTPPASPGPAADPIQAIAGLSPHQVIAAAAAAREDATGYVAWKESKASNIERLTALTRDLDAAITRMRADEVGRKYPPGDVFAARAALRTLRLFLREKGD